MIKKRFQDENEILNLKTDDILWDELTMGQSVNFIDNTMGNYYHIIEIEKESLSSYAIVNKYDKSVNFVEQTIIPTVLINMKYEDRIFKVEFDSPDEEAKFRLCLI